MYVLVIDRSCRIVGRPLATTLLVSGFALFFHPREKGFT